MKRQLKKILLVLMPFLFLLIETAAAQCAMCRATLESNVSDGTFLITSDNLNTGIIYLFTSPYMLIIAVALIWYYNARKNARTNHSRGYTQN